MAKITFIQPDGVAKTVDAEAGLSVMEAARQNDVDGIHAECGGMCSCSTCHCYIAEEWFAKLTPMEDDEEGLLEFAWEPRETSRLTCQITVTDALDGLVLRVPEQQI